jgi:hypothetical protein
MECVRSHPDKRPVDMVEVKRRLEAMHFHMTRKPTERAPLLPPVDKVDITANRIGTI